MHIRMWATKRKPGKATVKTVTSKAGFGAGTTAGKPIAARPNELLMRSEKNFAELERWFATDSDVPEDAEPTRYRCQVEKCPHSF